MYSFASMNEKTEKVSFSDILAGFSTRCTRFGNIFKVVLLSIEKGVIRIDRNCQHENHEILFSGFHTILLHCTLLKIGHILGDRKYSNLG